MGSRASRKLQAGDFVRFTARASGYRRSPLDVIEPCWTLIEIGTCGLVVDAESSNPFGGTFQDDGEEDGLVALAPLRWTACLIDGEVLLFPPLEAKTRRLNRRSP